MRVILIILASVIALLFSGCSESRVASVPRESSATVSASQKEAWEVEWSKAITEAKREGKVVVYGVPGIDIREAMINEFQKAYPGITVEYSGLSGVEAATKIHNERKAGIYLPDIRIGGTSAIVGVLDDAAQPLEPLLLLPEVRNPKNWLGGKLEYADKAGKINLVMSSYLSGFLLYNTKLLDPGKAKELSLWDLTMPEWKGKILIQDMRIPGSGGAFGQFLYYNPKLGPDFIKALAKNDPIVLRDARQMTQWVAMAKYPIQLAPNTQIVLEFTQIGEPLMIQYHTKEGSYIAAGFGSVMAVDKAPHPNATKVYLNWLLSKEGQTVFSKVMNVASRRIDVPTDYLNPGTVLQQRVEYMETYSESSIAREATAYDFMKEVFGR